MARRGPKTIQAAITDYCAFNPADAHDMTPTEIRDYFTQSNFDAMFGEDGDISHWRYTFEELATAAIEMAKNG